jgi:hypothetical protein
MAMPLSVEDIVYQVVLDSSADLDPVTSPTDEEDLVLKPMWATSLSCSHDFLDGTFPLDEAIIESMNCFNKPWDDMHHRSYFLLELERIEQDDFRSTLSEIVGHIVVPLDTHDIYAERNMASISPTITINFSCTPDKIQNVHIGADCSPEEILIYTELLLLKPFGVLYYGTPFTATFSSWILYASKVHSLIEKQIPRHTLVVLQ